MPFELWSNEFTVQLHFVHTLDGIILESIHKYFGGEGETYKGWVNKNLGPKQFQSVLGGGRDSQVPTHPKPLPTTTKVFMDSGHFRN